MNVTVSPAATNVSSVSFTTTVPVDLAITSAGFATNLPLSSYLYVATPITLYVVFSPAANTR